MSIRGYEIHEGRDRWSIWDLGNHRYWKGGYTSYEAADKAAWHWFHPYIKWETHVAGVEFWRRNVSFGEQTRLLWAKYAPEYMNRIRDFYQDARELAEALEIADFRPGYLDDMGILDEILEGKHVVEFTR